MPDDKDDMIEVVDDIITDMNIETITLDDVELNGKEIKENIPTEPLISNDISGAAEDISFEPINIEFEDQKSGTKIQGLDTLQNVTEPEMPVEGVLQSEETRAESAVPKASSPEIDQVFTTSEDDIITIEGTELDRLIYGDLKEDIQKSEPMPSDFINEIPVIEESAIEEEKAAAPEPLKEEELVPAMDVKTEEKPRSAGTDFNFDLSDIPDIPEVEEDEPIALSLDELNKIDISEENVIEYEAPTAPEVPEVPSDFTLEEGENVEISLDEINKIGEGLPEGEKVSPDAYMFETPENKELKEEIIEQKIDILSDSSKEELKKVLGYLDNLLENLPEDKIKEFAKSEYYDLYVKILNKLGI